MLEKTSRHVPGRAYRTSFTHRKGRGRSSVLPSYRPDKPFAEHTQS